MCSFYFTYFFFFYTFLPLGRERLTCNFPPFSSNIFTLQTWLDLQEDWNTFGTVKLSLVELGPGTKEIGPTLEYISTHRLHTSCFQLMMQTTKLIKKLRNLPKYLEEKGSQILRKMEQCDLNSPHELKAAIIHRWCHKCLVDKYQITYRICGGKVWSFSGIGML